MRVLLQVELAPPPAGGSRQITHAMLIAPGIRSNLGVWQEPASGAEEVHLLLENTVDVPKVRTSPHKLILSGGAEGAEQIAVLDNIMLR
jgi:hypothetical protein